MAELADTSAAAQAFLIEGYRRMPAYKKLRQVAQLNASAQTMALLRIKQQYGPLSEREQKLRLAALWLPRETMIKYFDWDPQQQGY
jgi:hypothetical protein